MKLKNWEEIYKNGKRMIEYTNDECHAWIHPHNNGFVSNFVLLPKEGCQSLWHETMMDATDWAEKLILAYSKEESIEREK